MRASGDPEFLASGPWGQTVAMVDATFRMLSTGASWSGNERNHLFLGQPGKGEFVRVSGISGLDDEGDSMAAAMLDFDRDGWMDIALGNISKPRFRLLRNNVKNRLRGDENGFVAMRFIGGNDKAASSTEWSARNGIGTWVTIELDNGRRMVREYGRDGGFKSENTEILLVGTGASPLVKTIEVRWPSGRTQSVGDVETGTLVTMYENDTQSPTGEAAMRERYARTSQVSAAPTTLRIAGAHGEKGLTVYTTMSTFCAVCTASQPDLRVLRKAFGKGEVTLVGVPVSDIDTKEKLQSYVRKKKPAYEVQIGLSAETTQRVRDTVVARLHGEGDATPASIITDSAGRILSVRWGVPTLSELRKLRAKQQSELSSR